MAKNGFIGVGALVVCAIVAALLVGFVLAFIGQYGEFEYTTTSGETGTASYCTASYGPPICQTADGTTIMVERYIKK